MQFDDAYLEEEYGDTYPTQTTRRIPGMYPSRPQEADYDDPYSRKTEAFSRNVPSRASAGRSRVTSAATRPERAQARRTDDDPVIRQPQPTQRPWTRRRVLNSILYGGSTIIAISSLTLMGKSALDRNTEDVQEGQTRASSLELVCGHHDSPEQKTLLHCFVEQSGDIYTRVNLLEYPGGSAAKLHVFQSDDLRSKYDPAELSRVDLQMLAMPVGGGKYQIQLTLTLSQKNVFSLRPDPVHILLVDRGHGYFEPVEPKK